MMERIDRIRQHPVWLESMEKIRLLEQDRLFCRHDMQHFLDVARLAWIEALEKGLDFPKEEVYAAALIHDIGRHLQYTEKIPHEQGSANLGERILADCGFTPEERQRILLAIRGHRNRESGGTDDLGGLLYRADKGSRDCLFCNARAMCNWSEEKKNLTLIG